jgi:alpha-1,6-rhamnosyltransferase
MRLKPVIVHLWTSQFCMGGVLRFFHDLSNWASDWADVHLLYCRGTDQFWQPTTKATLHRCDTPAAAMARLRELQPDLVHHHYPANGYLLPELHYLAPVIGTAHGWHYGCKESVGDWVYPVSGPSSQVIRLGIPVNQYSVKSHQEKTPLVVGIVGRRAREKFPESFLARLDKGLPEGVILRVIGEGWRHPDRDRITGRLEKVPGVELIGNTPPGDMPAMYGQLDALLVPSSTESVSYAALEAMASGLPVVARNVDGLPYTLGSAGILCDNDDQMIDALVQLRDDPWLRQQLGQRGRERVEQLFTLERMFAEYAEAYSKITGGRVRPPAANLDCSIVIPVYNTPVKWLRESMDSALSQEGNFEIVLVDDGSTNPDTLAGLRFYGALDNVRLVRHETNRGTAAALNTGILAARSDIIARHDSDDIMLPGRIARQVKYLKEHPETALVSGQMILMDETGKRSGLVPATYDPSLPMWDQPKEINPIRHSSATYRRHAVIYAGLYPPEYRCQDLALWCTMQILGYRIDVLDVLDYKYRIWDWEAKTATRLRYDRAIRNRFRTLAEAARRQQAQADVAGSACE